MEAGAARRAALVFLVLFVHSLHEGFAIGSASARTRGLGLFVLVAIAVQNIPQGTVTAIPLAIVAIDVAPDAWSAGSRVRATIGAAAGTALMVACALLLNVP